VTFLPLGFAWWNAEQLMRERCARDVLSTVR